MLYVLCVLGGVIIGLLIGFLMKRYIDNIEFEKMILEVEKASRGEYPKDDRKSREGKINLLYSELSVMYRRMEKYTELLCQEKLDMKDYIADISHQLKTPVTALSTYLQILKMQEKDKDRIAKLDSCIVLSDQMTQLIVNLLNMARLDADALKMNFEEYSVNNTLEQVAQQLRNSNVNSKAKITCKCDKDIFLRYDEGWMIEALFNIVKNAAMYAGDNPEIVIECIKQQQLTIIEISDNGSGIEEDKLKHIFERFYRVQGNTSNMKNSGIGIGLSMSKALIEKMHGRIEVHSDSNGTKFKIYFIETAAKDKI